MKRVFAYIVMLFLLVGSIPAQKETPPPGGKPRDFKLPEKTTFQLDNGLKVTLVPYGKLPKAAVRLVVRTGNIDEAENEVWLADLTVDMLKEGTQTRSAQQIASEAASMGGELNVSASADQSWIGGDVLSEFVPNMIELIADVVQHPTFPEEELPRLKRDYLRRLSISKTQAQTLALEKFSRVLYGNHPYGRLFPTEEMLQGYTIEQIQNFYSHNFGARRSHLYVVGVFDETAVKNAVSRAFADWEKGSEPRVNIPKPASARQIFLLDRPGAPQSTIIMGLPVIDPSQPDYIKLTVANALLGGSFSSRITANIREDKGYTYSPRSSIRTHYRDAYWAENADVTTQYTGASLKEIFYEIERLQKEPPTEEELKAIQNYIAGTFVLRNSSRGSILGMLAFIDLHGLGDDYLTHYIQRVFSVTPKDVQEMVKKYIRPEDMTIVVVGDPETVESQLIPFGKVVEE